ncbi:MAG TPA: 6-bladed beta-propeller, partial [Acidobacteriota bacterium]|nr:6-bladed beta-propeller [Acidobacteriota bacterium]
MRKTTAVILFLGATLALAWGCKGTKAWKGSIETVDGIKTVRNPKTPMYPQGALELREDLSIGAAEGAEEYMFIRLRGLEVDDEGAIYALDQRKPRIDVFSSAGAHLRSIGRKGQGPGEFQTPFYIAL